MSNSETKSFLSNEWLTLIFRLVMGGLFLYAAWNKFLFPRDFAITIAAYKILPVWSINIAAVMLPSLEMVIGIALIIGIFPRSAAKIMFGLMIVFVLSFLIATIKGVNLNDCGCFSTTHPIAEEDKGSGYNFLFMLRDFAFLLPLIQLVFFGNFKLFSLFSKD